MSILEPSGKAALQDVGNQFDKEISSLMPEWKEARSSIDRFDKITVDLRKYGFSFVTFIISSSSIFFDVSRVQNPLPLVIVPIVIALLILSIFIADSYYQVLLLAAILHGRRLENIHKEILSKNSVGQMYFGLNLTNYIEDKVQKTNAHFYTVLIYTLFLLITGSLGYFSIWAYELNTQSSHVANYFWMLTGGFVTILVILFIISRGVWKLIKEMRKIEMLDHRFVIEKLFDRKDVARVTKELAEKIYRAYKKEQFKVLTLGMGGLYFANSLISELKIKGMINVELISAFTERKGDQVTIEQPQESDVNGENILIVDDLVSTGITMVRAVEMCHALGAKSVRTCAMLDAHKKRHSSASKLRLDFSGLKSSEAKRFFVGSGLDGGKKMSPEARDQARLLPYIGVLVAPQDDGLE